MHPQLQVLTWLGQSHAALQPAPAMSLRDLLMSMPCVAIPHRNGRPPFVACLQLKNALLEILDQPGAEKPAFCRFFRGQMQTIISRALAELDIKPLPSRRCFTLMGEGPELLSWGCLVQLLFRLHVQGDPSCTACSCCFVGDMAVYPCPAPAGAASPAGVIARHGSFISSALQSQARVLWGGHASQSGDTGWLEKQETAASSIDPLL